MLYLLIVIFLPILLVLGLLITLWWLEARAFLMLFEKLCYRVDRSSTFIENISQHFSGHARIIENLSSIQQEYQLFTQKNGKIPKAHEVDTYNTDISEPEGPAWRTFYLKVYNGWFEENVRNFPITTQLLKQMPEVTCVMFSVMEPGNVIPTHEGVMKGILRYQIPIHLSVNGECRISVNGQPRTYQLGQAIMFDDNNPHTVINNTDDHRVILFLDIQKSSSALVRRLDIFFMKLIIYSPKFKQANVGIVK